MISEIYGKISHSGTNLSDRLEDKLTGDVFGSLRYLPFDKAMKKVLLSGTNIDIINQVKDDFWSDKIKFWPNDSDGQLDAIIEFDNVIIGIEVKLYSGLSSDDNNYSVDCKESRNQLSRESRILMKRGQRNNKQMLLILVAPEDTAVPIFNDVIERKIIPTKVTLAYITWENIFDTIKNLLHSDNDLSAYEKVIIKDLYDLLNRKGFERFKSFDVGNYNISPEGYFDLKSSTCEQFKFVNQLTVNRGEYYEFK